MTQEEIKAAMTKSRKQMHKAIDKFYDEQESQLVVNPSYWDGDQLTSEYVEESCEITFMESDPTFYYKD